MLTLHDSVDTVKSILKWGGIIIGIVLLIIFLYRGGKFMIAVLFPNKPPPPAAAFGKLPAIQFPESATQKTLTYQIDTVDGTLGSFIDRVNVYKTITPVPNLLNLSQTRELLQKTGFSAGERIITDTVYSWSDISNPDKTITINIVSRDFSISSNFLADPLVVNPRGILNETESIQQATKFLESLERYPLDIDSTKTKTKLFSIQGISVFPATSISSTQLIRVDFFQKDIDKLPIVYPKAVASPMYFLIGGGNTTLQIVEAKFSHQSISEENSSYPLKSVQQAFDDLKKGKGYIASYYGSGNEILIKKVYIGYYLDEEKQEYLQPVFVFEGNNGFVGYVAAVSEETPPQEN